MATITISNMTSVMISMVITSPTTTPNDGVNHWHHRHRRQPRTGGFRH
jgi:hypothetical protein